MERFFTKTFFRFFTGFVIIISIAFGVLAVTSSQLERHTVDNVATPE